jgi:catechol-2,3-dioxygenase
MPDLSLKLNHVQMPARDPEGLARWYSETFDLRAQQNRVYGPAFLIVFQPGQPVERAPDFHVGLNVTSMQALGLWADKLGAKVISGRTEYASIFVSDPEGNGVELYCLADS